MRDTETDLLSPGANASAAHDPHVDRPPGRRLVELLEHARFEVLPTPSVTAQVGEHVPVGRTITVTASTSRGLEATLETAVALARAGYDVVPHVAARMVADRAHLADILARLRAAGVDRIFVPGGDADPVGSYPDAISLLGDLTLLLDQTHADAGADHPARSWRSVGITAYPESHPSISDDQTIQAMWDKRRHATEMVSNLTFDPDGLATWLTRVRGRGVALPLWLGIPGPTDPAKLLMVAGRIGVGESTRFLVKNRRTVGRLLRPGGFSSADFLRRAEPVLARPQNRVAGLHVFTFNQVAETEAWRVRQLEDLSSRSGRLTTRRPPRTR